MKRNLLVLGFLAVSLSYCGSSSSGGTSGSSGGSTSDAGSADAVSPSTVAQRIGNAADTLVANMDNSGVSASLTRHAIVGDEADWATYVDASNDDYLAEIFGSASSASQVVTKIRVLIDQFQNTVDGIVTADPSVNCTGAAALNEGDTISIAFFGSLGNGTSSDRHFDCQYLGSTTDTTRVFLYGRDASGNFYIVDMILSGGTNTEDAATRGPRYSLYQVVQATYGETAAADETSGFLDLQYTQFSNYSGADDIFSSSDDVNFKSRSRITGRVGLNSSGEQTSGAGEFLVTKFDRGVNDDASTFEITTKTHGRGDSTAGGFLEFAIDSDATPFAAIPGTFCVQTPSTSGTLPAWVDPTNCSSLETAFAWGTTTFPFDITPSLSATFVDNAVFEANDTDMIADDLANFIIPTYTTI